MYKFVLLIFYILRYLHITNFKFANETIMQLDCLVDEDCGGEKFKEQLRNIMMDM